MGQKRNSQEISVGKLKGKRELSKPRNRRED
jgi:hypothetical protein